MRLPLSEVTRLMILLSYTSDPKLSRHLGAVATFEGTKPRPHTHRGENSRRLAQSRPPVSRTASSVCLASTTTVAGSSLSRLRIT